MAEDDPNWSGRSRRQAERVLFAYITDISALGIFVLTNNPEPPGTRLNLRFRTTPGEAPLEVEGQVIWINRYRPDQQEENLNPGMGIQFQDLSPQQREQVLK